MKALIPLLLATLTGCASPVPQDAPGASDAGPIEPYDPTCPPALQCALGWAWTPHDGATVTLAPGCEPTGTAWESDTIPNEPSQWYYVGVGAYRWCLRSGVQLTCTDTVGGMYTCSAIAKSLHRR